MSAKTCHQCIAESMVLIIMTGGTICMKRSPNGFIPARGFLEAGLAPRPSFNDGSNPDPVEVVTRKGQVKALPSLRTPCSQYNRHVRYAVLEFEELLDSSSIDAKGWAEIAQTIYRNYQLFDAFVVLHGTDSLAYTCSALSFMLQHLGKPVILTGSQAPMLELQNDATDNLLGSLIIAGHFMIPEVCLYFGHKLLRGNRALKVSANEFAAFAAPNYPPLATITSLKTHVSWDLVHRPVHLKFFRVQINLDTAHVACLRIFPGIKPEMVEAVLKVTGLRGLVLETFGAGNAPGGPDSIMTRIFSDAVQRGIVIVNVTQCMTGSVNPLYEPAMLLERAGVVPGYDQTSEAALTKLSYLLALPELSSEDIVKKMSSNLCGELTEHSQVTFQHPGDDSPSRQVRLSRLHYAIAEGNINQVREFTKSEAKWLTNEGDYTGNTPMESVFLAIYRSCLTRPIASRSDRARYRSSTDAPLARRVGAPAKQGWLYSALLGSPRRLIGARRTASGVWRTSACQRTRGRTAALSTQRKYLAQCRSVTR